MSNENPFPTSEQPPIIDRTLFDAVQAKLEEQNNNHKTTRMKSEALLAGRIVELAKDGVLDVDKLADQARSGLK